MPSIEKVTVVGSGSWGTALGNVFSDQGCSVMLWGRDKLLVEAINKKHENTRYLKGVALHHGLRATTDLSEAIERAEFVVCSIPTQQIRAVFASQGAMLKGKTVLNTSKGIEIGTHKRISEIFSEIAPGVAYAILSGPSFAEEVARRLPTAVTLAASDEKIAERLQRLVSGQYFRAYRAADVVGVELSGALKNVIAIATGMVSGLKLGYNAQAAIINRGIAEIARLGKKMHANPMTFLGLAGMGDLVLTCTGPLSRNRRLGIAFGEGKTLDDSIKHLGGVAEGYYTACSAFELSRELGVEMPITEEVYRILYEGQTVKEAVDKLMSRDLKEEW